MSVDNKKTASRKQLFILAALSALLLLLIGYMLMDSASEESMLQADQPVEVQQSMHFLDENNSASHPDLEGNATELGESLYLDDDIDKYFMTKAPTSQRNDAQASYNLEKKPLPNNGATVTLPNLTPPSQLPRGGVNMVGPGLGGPGNVVAGSPTQITLPQEAPSYQHLVINGIACNESGCRASTSNGLITKGSTVGGGIFATEKVESVTMNGIKTDKRFISY